MRLDSRLFFSVMVLALVSFISGCANNNNKTQWNYDGSSVVILMDTERYLPIQEQDENGVLLPYKAELNPYAELKGRINKKAVASYIEARRAFSLQQYDAADELLTQITQQEPKLSGPWVMRGDIAAVQSHTDQAMEHYIKAIDINPINFNAYIRLAVAQRKLGHFRHAQNTYTRALKLWPDAPEVHLNLGVLYDVYLNAPLKAQAHMEAYQLLQNDSNDEVVTWLSEIRSRTGVASTMKIIGPDGQLQLLSTESAKEIVVTEGRKPRTLVASELE